MSVVLLSESRRLGPALYVYEILGAGRVVGARHTSSLVWISYRYDILTVDVTLVSYPLIRYLSSELRIEKVS